MDKIEDLGSIRVLLADENKAFGGAERHVLTLATELQEQGVLAALAARKQSWLAQNTGGLPFHAVGFRNEVDMLSVYNLYRKIKSDQVNIIHCISHRDLVASALARELPGAPKTYLIKAEHSYPDDNLSSLYRWAYRQCHAITSVSQSLRTSMLAAVSPEKMTLTPVIHNGSRYPDSISPSEPLGERPLRIGVLSALRPGKGHSDFLQAMANVTDVTDQAFEISLAGDGELLDALRAQAQSLGLNVKFWGHVEDPFEYLSHIDLSVVPSHKETFSLTASESMASGKAMICADSEGVKEVCKDYPVSLYPTGDISALTQAISDFCQAPEKKLEASLAEAEKARMSFSSQQMAASYIGLYRELLAIS